MVYNSVDLDLGNHINLKKKYRNLILSNEGENAGVNKCIWGESGRRAGVVSEEVLWESDRLEFVKTQRHT